MAKTKERPAGPRKSQIRVEPVFPVGDKDLQTRTRAQGARETVTERSF
jgi:hypothetical protein